ncbi:hypothetical protein GF325_04365 [Candidatus Bathyarchaeota archaeon]|nr:hypothetical protein [Candidatus Bathyarchaeota archaeon]
MDFQPYPLTLGNDITSNAVNTLQEKLRVPGKYRDTFEKIHIFLGLDGYVDSLYSLLSKRASLVDYEVMDSMREFSQRAFDTAGSSCNIERVLKKRLGGGFGPNTARAVGTLGAQVDLVGALGNPSEVFMDSIPNRVTMHSLGDPGETCALEFDDGKIMLTDFGNINHITWDLILERVGRDDFIGMLEKTDAIGQGHWALVPHMNDIWRSWVHEILPNLSRGDRLFFVDPADMTKRPGSHVREMIDLLGEIGETPGMKTIISMNDKETLQMCNYYQELPAISEFRDYYTIGDRMINLLPVDIIVIHHPHFAILNDGDRGIHVKEGFTSKPKFTTAAGDHFNGGLIIALASKSMTPGESLVFANACTAHFVRTGNSPNLQDASRFIMHYKEYIENDIDTIA